MQSQPDGFERIHINPLSKARLVSQQPVQLGLQGISQGVGKRGQQNARIGMLTCQVRSTVQGNDGLAGARRAGDAGRTVVVSLHPLPLFWVKKNRPFFPRKV